MLIDWTGCTVEHSHWCRRQHQRAGEWRCGFSILVCF
jgi:hypothetical protein